MAEDRAQDGQPKEPTPRVEKTVVLNRDEILRMAQVESGGKSESGNTAQLPRAELDRARAGHIPDSGKDSDTRQRARVREERPRVIREGETHTGERRVTQPRGASSPEQGGARHAPEQSHAERQPGQASQPRHSRGQGQQLPRAAHPTAPVERSAQASHARRPQGQVAGQRRTTNGSARQGQPRQQARPASRQHATVVQGVRTPQHRSTQRTQGQPQPRAQRRVAANASQARPQQERSRHNDGRPRPQQQAQSRQGARAASAAGGRRAQQPRQGGQRPVARHPQQAPQARHTQPQHRQGAPVARQATHRQGQPHPQQRPAHQGARPQQRTQRRPQASQVRPQQPQHGGRSGAGQNRPPAGGQHQQPLRGPRKRTSIVAIVAAVAIVLVVVFAAVRCNNARIAAQQAEQAQQEQAQQEQAKATQIAGLEAGTYYIEPVDTESGVLAFDVSGVGDDAYTTVMVSELTQTSAQQIKLDISDDGSTCTLTNGNLYLDAGDVTAGAGRSLFANKSDGGNTQRWKLSQNSDGSYSIISAASDDLAIAVQSAYDGAPVTVEETDSTSEAQHFRILAQSRVDTTSSANANGNANANANSDGNDADNTNGAADGDSSDASDASTADEADGSGYSGSNGE